MRNATLTKGKWGKGVAAKPQLSAGDASGGSPVEARFDILIVDSDADLASNLQDVLGLEGYGTALAHDGQTALDLGCTRAFDLAIIDTDLTDTSGVKLIKKFTVSSPGTEYIISTSNTSPETAIEAVGQRGVVGYEIKPFNMDHLLVLISQVAERKRAEKALREAEQRYRAIFEQAADAIVLINVETGELVDFNAKAHEDLGYSRAEFRKLKVPDFDANVSAAEAARRIKKIVREGSDLFETQHRTKDGEIREVQVSSRIISTAGRDFIQSIWRDITEHRQAEEALRESEERYRTIFESANDVLLLIDKKGKILDVNQMIGEVGGYEKEELIGRNIRALTSILTKKSMAIVVKNFLKRMVGLHVPPYEVDFIRKDGGLAHVEISAVAVKKDGKIVGDLAILRDVTERKQAEQLFRTAFASSPIGIYIVQDGKFRLVNPEFQKLTGYSEDELLGMDSMALIFPRDREMVRENAVKMLKEERLAPYEYRLVNKSGETRWSIESVVSIQYQGRRATMGSFIDITEQKHAEAEKIELEQKAQLTSRLASVGEMASGIAHEINNPLTGVIGFSQLLMLKDIPEDIKEDVATINDGAQRVADIVKRLLTFARRHQPRRDYLSLNDIIETTLALRAYALRTGNINVITRLDADLPLTMADGVQLQQVILNIIINAETEMKLAHGSGKLSIKTERVDGAIRISFKDDGPGISKENLAKIFDPFFTTRQAGEGTGLGLSVCHGIITEHNGQIYVKSKLGKGATFIVELPIVNQCERQSLPEPEVEEYKKVSKAKILVVDDEPAVRDFLGRMLVNEGHQVESADSAKDALEKIQAKRYSLILLDIKLPGINGIELYQHLQGIAQSLARRVVFITGDVMGEDTRNFFAKTKAPYITKPFNTQQLKKEINRILSRIA